MRQFKSFSGQVIVITGATSCIGLSTARMLAKRGAALVLAASHVSTLDRLAGEIPQAGGSILAVPVDVTALDHSAVQQSGRIDTWINAGMAMDDPGGANHGARVARSLMAQEGGKIIHLDSNAGARHGVKGLTGTLRADRETEGVPIAVTLVCAAGRNDMHNARNATPWSAARHPHWRMASTPPRPVYSSGSGKSSRCAIRTKSRTPEVTRRATWAAWPGNGTCPGSLIHINDFCDADQ